MQARHAILLLGVVAWFGAAFWLPARGLLVSGHDEPPVALALAFRTPILLFLLSLRIAGWRALVVSLPPVRVDPLLLRAVDGHGAYHSIGTAAAKTELGRVHLARGRLLCCGWGQARSRTTECDRFRWEPEEH